MANDNTHTGGNWIWLMEKAEAAHGNGKRVLILPAPDMPHLLRVYETTSDKPIDWNTVERDAEFVCAVPAIASVPISRTPAEPKAGDWERELRRLAVLPGDAQSRMVEEDGGATTVHYAVLLRDVRRALSSAAPRITEQMVEGVHAEVLAECCKGGRPFFDAPREIKDRLIALLRQQGAERGEDQQGAGNEQD